MKLHPTQSLVAKDLHRFRVCCNGRRWGKTALACEEIKGKSLAKPSRIVYIAPTYQQARDIAWDLLKRELQPITLVTNESRLELRVRTIKGGESLILLRGWESIETLRGQQFDFQVLDEVAMCRGFQQKWEEVLRPTLTDTKGEALFLSTPRGFNHFYDLFNKEKEDTDYKSFRFTSYDNPYLPREEIDKAREELTDDRFAQEYLADFRKVEGLIWDLPQESIYSANDPVISKMLEHPDYIIGGIDWGFRHDAALVVLKAKDGVFYMTQEFKKAQVSNPEFFDIIKQTMKGNKVSVWFPDSARPDLIEELKKAQVPCGETDKDVPLGLSHVAGLIRTKRLFISGNCSQFLDEVLQYQYMPEVDGKPGKETPLKINDDLCDALRYACMGFRALMPEPKPDLYKAIKPLSQSIESRLNRERVSRPDRKRKDSYA